MSWTSLSALSLFLLSTPSDEPFKLQQTDYLRHVTDAPSSRPPPHSDDDVTSLHRFALRRSAPTTLRTVFRTQQRNFVGSAYLSKTLTDSVKDAAAKVNRVVSDAALGAVEGGEKATDAVKDSTSPITDTLKSAFGNAQAEAKKGGSEIEKNASKAYADVKSGLDKAAAEAEKKPL
ncbi:BQ5605_C004g02936 [Microbotryum silenes-dioicae]|uniref:BQ5605_C004g02936 protein n=1 Tax=Microbotryum silenes-dioicae TaxID=796604 RepID=A0A2X0PBA0_9BASI|nr:BQ5605_C004g02936 [Microbotryum silenes-dioicae]